MTIKEVTINGDKKSWRVTWSELGKPERRFFPTEAAANKFGADTLALLAESGSAFSKLTLLERNEAATIIGLAKENGVTLVEVWRDWEGINKGKPKAKVTMRELVDKAVASKNKAAAAGQMNLKYAQNFSSTCELFIEGERETTLASKITTEEIEAWLDEMVEERDWGANSQRRVLVDLCSLFNSDRLLAKDNPASGKTLKRPVTAQEEPGTFTPLQAWDLMDYCEREHPTLLGWLALCLFTGCRVSEAAKVDWSQIDFSEGHISLLGKHTKTKQNRYPKLRPAAVSWLQRCRKESGPVAPENLGHLANQLREGFGLWPRNVCRHSFISYLVAAENNVQATALEAGNSPSMIFKHYRKPVKQSTGELFWSLRAGGQRPGHATNIVPMVAPAVATV